MVLSTMTAIYRKVRQIEISISNISNETNIRGSNWITKQIISRQNKV